MRELNEIFGFERFAGYMTSTQLKKCTEHIKTYKGYSIAFGKYQRAKNGGCCWKVRVWKNEGRDRFGCFTMKCRCTTDMDAMSMATRWAKENIDRILEA